MTRRGLLRLALPSKGRLAEPATRLLSDAGIQFETTGRTLHAKAHDLDLDLLLARSDDIPVWTAAGDVDLGIAGQNQIVETGADVEPLLELGFGRCRLVLAVPDGASIGSLADLAGTRIATSYPRTVTARLEAAGVEASVVTLGGSVELAPRLHAADAIVDLVSSGDTLRQNGLVELETLLESQAVLIARRDLSHEQRALADELQLLIDSVLAARPKRYVMLNA
ncbi:MAG: phosphoribosyltransferase, partial [Gaiellales bacterium]|nr:phosphoribosyltransferase [Gaiellales bacterium]